MRARRAGRSPPGNPAPNVGRSRRWSWPGRLREAIDRLNPRMPAAAREDAFRKVAVPDRPPLLADNRTFHQRLRNESRG